MAAIWLRNPADILADGARGGIVVEGPWIKELVPAGARPQEEVAVVIDASEHVVLPGLINVHHHLYQGLAGGAGAGLAEAREGWLRAHMGRWARLDGAALRLAARRALVQLAKGGCTTVVDHQDALPAGLDDAVDIVVEAARDVGLRLVVAVGGQDLAVEEGGSLPASQTCSAEAILEACTRAIRRHHQPAPGAMTQVALGPASPLAASRWLFEEMAALASLHDVRLHTHLAATADEASRCRQRFHAGLVDYLDAVGWLQPRTWLAHAAHLPAPDHGRLREQGLAVAYCPSAELMRGAGVAPTAAMARMGLPIGLGSDGIAGGDDGTFKAELRLALLSQRGARGAAALDPRRVLHWATAGGADCLGRTDIGRLAPGCAADLALYRLDPWHADGTDDPLSALVASGLPPADRVMVAGRWVVVDRALAALDEAALAATLDAERRRLHAHIA
ncbi:MAG: 8-oxoguanine deaminase [Geminicoccaceae bacterium]|nr:MAG: 8-oxoguanine deaminase [Geminicoccaceae bacterium]